MEYKESPSPNADGVETAGTTTCVANDNQENVEVIYAEADPETGLSKIESMCMKCGENGTTRMLIHSIPHFKDVILSSFECPHCGYRNNDLQQGSPIQPFGCRVELRIKSVEDLNRQIIKSEFASLTVVEIEFEIPPNTQRGVVSTLEGILSSAAMNLEHGQPDRRARQAEVASKIDVVIEKLKAFSFGQSLPFTVILEDPSGNSYIETPFSDPKMDSEMTVTKTHRSRDKLHAMGYYEEQGNEGNAEGSLEKSTVANVPSDMKKGADIPDRFRCSYKWDFNKTIEENLTTEYTDETLQFAVNCPHCGAAGHNNMCEIDIPGFRKCIIMAFVCDICGAKDSEVKSAGAYGDKAKKFTLTVRDKEDLNRDVLKSDIASITIPKLDFEMMSGTQGGVFTTVEGLLTRTADRLAESHPFNLGDSAVPSKKAAYSAAIEKLRNLASDPSQLPFTIILDDAADMSFIGNRLNSPKDSLDPDLVIEEYERTAEQNDDLGLTDMKVENYSDE